MEQSPPSHLRQLARAASLVMFFFVTSRTLGLLRDVIITQQFGTSREYEAYLAAFRIPDFIFNIVASGALASAFIPLFSALVARGELPRSWQLASHVINLVFVAMTAIALIVAFFAEPLVKATVAVGFSPVEQLLTVHLMRLMLVTPIVFGVSGIVMGVLNSHQHFVLPALAPVMYNVGIIGGALWLAPQPAFGVYGLALGVVVGACLHLLVQVPWLVRARMEYRLELGLHDENVRAVIRLMLPRTLGIAAVQINFLVNTILASTLPEGRLAAFSLAFALMLLPEGVIAQSIGTVLFPTFSQLVARNERGALRQSFSMGLRVVFFLTIPASLGLILLGTPIIQLLYARGAFTTESTVQTAFALQFFAVGLFAHSGLEIVTRAFYALHDTATPVKIGVAAIALNIVLSLVLLPVLAQGGLALANSLATMAEMLILIYLLRSRMGGVNGMQILRSLGKILPAALVMGLAIVLCLMVGMNVWLRAGVGVTLGGTVFLLVAFLLRSEELIWVWQLVRRRE